MVLKREPTPLEQGNLIVWLVTVEGEALYPAGRATGSERAQASVAGRSQLRPAL